MGITSIVNGKTVKAEDHLALQMKLHLGVDVDPEKLKAFLQSKWVALSHLAHSIHADTADTADRPEVEREIIRQFQHKEIGYRLIESPEGDRLQYYQEPA